MHTEVKTRDSSVGRATEAEISEVSSPRPFLLTFPLSSYSTTSAHRIFKQLTYSGKLLVR